MRVAHARYKPLGAVVSDKSFEAVVLVLIVLNVITVRCWGRPRGVLAVCVMHRAY